MGMFDTVHAPTLGVVCPKCAAVMPGEYQTKSFESSMATYVLKQDAAGKWRLVKAGPPDKSFWHEYTTDEITKMEAGGALDKLWAAQGGYFNNEAFDIANREELAMGDLPHQHADMYDSCKACGTWVDVDLVFTHGVLEKWTTRTVDQ